MRSGASWTCALLVEVATLAQHSRHVGTPVMETQRSRGRAKKLERVAASHTYHLDAKTLPQRLLRDAPIPCPADPDALAWLVEKSGLVKALDYRGSGVPRTLHGWRINLDSTAWQEALQRWAWRNDPARLLWVGRAQTAEQLQERLANRHERAQAPLAEDPPGIWELDSWLYARGLPAWDHELRNTRGAKLQSAYVTQDGIDKTALILRVADPAERAVLVRTLDLTAEAVRRLGAATTLDVASLLAVLEAYEQQAS
jgi:hypothetical protein